MDMVELVDWMPRENLDEAVVDAARVSVGKKRTTPSRDRTLIRYLMRHHHTSPFEMVDFKFRIKMPIYIARQHMRHRMASINEVSGRYSKLDTDYYVTSPINFQATDNHQGCSEEMPGRDQELVKDIQNDSCDLAFKAYEELINLGVSREQARAHLPLSTYTTFIWKINMHNLMNYLQLRMDSHAQREIREYAESIYAKVRPLAPECFQAFEDYRLKSVTFTGPELDYLRGGQALGLRERKEFDRKVWIVYHCYRYLLWNFFAQWYRWSVLYVGNSIRWIRGDATST